MAFRAEGLSASFASLAWLEKNGLKHLLEPAPAKAMPEGHAGIWGGLRSLKWP